MKNFQLATGLLIAAATGWVAGILTAPRSGKSTRRKVLLELLKQKMELQDKVEASYDELVDSASLKTSQIKRNAGKKLKSAMNRHQ